MIDTHAHIDTEAFHDDRAAVLERAWAAGLQAIVIPSIAPEGFDALQALVEEDERLYRGIGIHPHNVAHATKADIERVERGSDNTRVVAIGEIGLDYYYDFAPRDVQQKVFREQLRIAKRVAKPVIIHNRDSDEDILRILQEEQDGSLQGVLHCFSSDTEVLRRAIDVGMHVSFTGNITFKKSTLDEVVRSVPAGRFMIETDSPYITPVPYRGKRNEPAHVRFVAEKIAELRNITLDEVITMTSTTAQKLFRLFSLLLLCSVCSFAQSSRDDEGEHPYPKKLGFSIIGATNTIVESRSTPGTSDDLGTISFEGFLAYGGAVHYSLSDRLMLEGAYLYSVNKKVMYDRNDASKQIQSNPNTHGVVELMVRYLTNPYSRVVFYGSLGGCLFMNEYNGGEKAGRDPISGNEGTSSTVLGIGGGIGLFVNIKTPIGLFTPGGEWRVDFFLNSEQRVTQFTSGKLGLADISTYFSLPRISVAWYPNL